MKELINKTNKKEWLRVGIYKVSIYICWYLFAIIFNYFLHDELTDTKLILLVISIIVVYILRTSLKMICKKEETDCLYHMKHSIEMHYFGLLKNISYENLENIQKEDLTNKILEVSYNYTKIIFDIFDIIIPSAIGLLIIFVKLIDINKLFGIIAFVLLVGILLYSYYNLEEDKIIYINKNELLKDFILKIHTIKKLNIFDYCIEKLNNVRENDEIILNDNNTISNIKFINFIFAFISLIFLSTFIFIGDTMTRLGTIIFFSIIIIKLQELLYKINPTIKNMFSSSKNRIILEEYYKKESFNNINDSWKKISILNGIINYKETTKDIKIPSFEIVRKDHISILGESGQGKSTLLNVLSGSFSLDKGNIMFDGNETNEVVDATYISSDVDILNISLRDNLKFNKDITDEEIVELINEIGLTTWVNSLPNGISEIIANNIDANIKDKINIIRTIIADKNIIFLDNPTDNLDSDEEKIVAKMIKKYFKEKTYIIISKKTVLTNLCKKHYFIKNHTLLEKEPLL